MTPTEITALAERLEELASVCETAAGLAQDRARSETSDTLRRGFAEAATALRALLAEREGMRGALMEEAALICEAQAVAFASPQYATQPMGSLAERFACKECADAIRKSALAPKEPERG